jgi:Na+/H+ antiporter NhaD/arsenite permease-like protein
MGVVIETGVFNDVAGWFGYQYSDIWLVAVVSGLLSSAVDTFTIAMTDISLYPIGADHFATNGAYWKLIPYCTAVGGCLTTVGSISGIAMMKMEHMHLGWYLRNMSWKVLIGALVGLGVLYLELTYMG